jgi:hypothetical protein
MLMSVAEIQVASEPYNECIDSTQGERHDLAMGTTREEHFGWFCQECYRRYHTDNDIMVQYQGSNTFVCWDQNGNIHAILDFDAFVANFG